MIIKEYRKRLLDLLKEKALVIGKVKLSSGKESDYYLDERIVTLMPEGAYLTAKIMIHMLKDINVDAIGGMTLAADPIIGAVTAMSYADNQPLSGLIVRKEPKGHGMGKQVEGPVKKGLKVAVVDGTMTTGGSVLKAVEALERVGCEIVKVIIMIDRLEGGKENVEAEGYSIESVFTRHDLFNQ
ncbi:orotate phosphoribosyltransferase [Candidatus Poribacteria bacterium]|nr:orotate phosphoribosyltransferase [Candidatus Poribacteria bacterium]